MVSKREARRENVIVGLDIGTNSIGWAIVELDAENHPIVKRAVKIFRGRIIKVSQEK